MKTSKKALKKTGTAKIKKSAPEKKQKPLTDPKETNRFITDDDDFEFQLDDDIKEFDEFDEFDDDDD